MDKRILAALASLAILGPAWADPDLVEEADAGSTPATAQTTRGDGALETISGHLSKLGADVDLEDMYLIRIVDAGAFTAQTFTPPGSASFDTQLWLFDADGLGLLANDDAALGVPGSRLTGASDDGTGIVLAEGLYLLAVSGAGNDPHSLAGPIFAGGDVGISGPDGAGGGQAVTLWDADGTPAVGSYTIALSGAAYATIDTCPADVNGDGKVGVQDQVAVILAWNQSGTPADINADGVVNVSDLLQVLLDWGPCPLGKKACPTDGDCFAAHAAGGCEDEACCATVCGSDPFCCDVAWDQICAETALQFCQATTACPGKGSCFLPNGTGGCDCEPCCFLICAQDPFCCEAAWDELCAQDAARQCVGCPGCPGEGDCFQANGSPGCESESCCNQVCALDASCCELEWDQACVDLATELCGLPCPGAGDCYKPNGSPGCDEETCCQLVCDADPFCCAQSWDQLCADQAVSLCSDGCELSCTPGSLVENEPCGEDVNGGCNSTPVGFSAIACGDHICGTSYSNGGTRDTDWYLIQTTGACTSLTATLTSEFSGVVYVVGGIETCEPVQLGEAGDGNLCQAGVPATASVGPGTYVIFVAPAGYDGFPCGTLNGYQLILQCASEPDGCE